MVGHHVPEGTGFFVVATTLLDTDLLCHGDLDVIHVASVPDGLENAVRESEHQDVLDGLLSQIVVDSVDLLLAQRLPEITVQVTGGLEIPPERLLDDHPPPVPGGLPDKARLAELTDDPGEGTRRRCEVVQVVSTSFVLRIHAGELARQAPVGVRVTEIASDIADALLQPVPGFGSELVLEELPDVPVEPIDEGLRREFAACDADDGEALRQQPSRREIVESRNQLALGEITRGPEDHRHTRPRWIARSRLRPDHEYLIQLSARRSLHVAAELVSHGREHLLREGALLT